MPVLLLFPLVGFVAIASTWGLIPKNLKALSARLFISGGFGFLILTLLSTLLLFMGVLNRKAFWTLYLLIAGVITLAGYQRSKLEKEDPEPLEKGTQRFTLPETISLFISLAVLVHTFLGALTPEVRSDPLQYHLRLAQQYALRGEIEPLRENPWWAIPQYAESVYATGILLSNDTLAKLFHWMAGFLTFAGVYAFTRARFGQASACWALVLWATTPKISYEMTTTYVEMILTLWVFGSALCGFAALETGDPKRAGRFLILSGFLMGMAFGTKYTAFAVQGLPWMLFPCAFLLTSKRSLRNRLVPFLLSGIALLIADSPWLLRNAYHTGNPIYPLYNHLFGLTEGVDRGIEMFFLTVWPGKSLMNPEFYMERLIGLLYSGYVFPGLAILLPLFLRLTKPKEDSASKTTTTDRIILLYCFLSFLCYLIFTGNMDGRFYIPTLAILTCYLGRHLALVIGRIAPSSKASQRQGSPTGTGALGRVLPVAVLFVLVYNYCGQRNAFFIHFQESPWPLLSEESRWGYYRKHLVGEPEGPFWEEVIPPDSMVYGIGFPHRVRAIHPLNQMVLDNSKDPPVPLRTNLDPVRDPFEEGDRTPEALKRILAEVGVNYLLLPTIKAWREEPFWSVAARTFPAVEGTEGRLLKVNGDGSTD